MIRLWDAVTGQVLREFLADHGGAANVALSQDGRLLAAGLADGRVRLWDPETGTIRGELPGHSGGVGCLAFGLGGQVLASGGRDSLIRLWDLSRLKELKKFTGHAGPITAVAFTARGDRLASGGEDTSIRLWETVTGEEKARFRGHGGAVTALGFSPDGQLLASGGWDRSARLWDLSAGKFSELTGLSGGVRAVMFTPDGRELFIGGGKVVKSWDPVTARPRRPVATLGAAVLAAALTPDGATLAVGGADGLIRLFDAATGMERCHLEGHRGPVVSLDYGPARAIAGVGEHRGIRGDASLAVPTSGERTGDSRRPSPSDGPGSIVGRPGWKRALVSVGPTGAGGEPGGGRGARARPVEAGEPGDGIASRSVVARRDPRLAGGGPARPDRQPGGAGCTGGSGRQRPDAAVTDAAAAAPGATGDLSAIFGIVARFRISISHIFHWKTRRRRD